MNTHCSRLGAVTLAAVMLTAVAAAPGCRCGGNAGDAGQDGGGGKLDSTVGTDASADAGGAAPTQCERICDLATGCGIPGIGGAACGGFCARADDGVLACLDTAAGSADCAGALDCILNAPPPPECDSICAFGDMCLVPGICDATCAIVNDATRDCAEEAEMQMDCTLFGACLLDPGTAKTCDDVCTFGVETCGQAIPFGTLGCVAACGSGLIPSVIVSCYQVAAFLGSCEAANVCGGLIGVPPPGSDAGTGGTDSATPGSDSAVPGSDSAPTPGTDSSAGPDGGPSGTDAG